MNPLLDLDARPIIGHRGASGLAPENTLQAFELALRDGADALELDVRLSRDGAPVVMHDATLDRTTSLAGAVRAQTLVDLRAADAGYRFTTDGGRTFPYRGTGVRIPTLGEVLWSFPRTPILLEIKEPEVQAAVQRVLLTEGAAERCVVASELPEALELFREPPFVCAASGPEISGAIPRRAAAPARAPREIPSALRAAQASPPHRTHRPHSWPPPGGWAARCTSGP